MPKQALTDKDIELLHETFADKDDLTRVEKKVDLLPSKELFISHMSELMGEVKAMRESQELHAQSHNDINDKLGKHDKRIKKLESITVVN